MKPSHLLIASALALLLTGADTPVKFVHYDDYHAKNSGDRERAFSCMAITTRAEFDDHFDVLFLGAGPAKSPTMLPSAAFDTRMIVAVVRSGKALWKFKIESASANGDVLTVRYKATKEDTPATTYVCPMVVAVPKGPYKTVTFIEDGKEVGKAKVGDAKKP